MQKPLFYVPAERSSDMTETNKFQTRLRVSIIRPRMRPRTRNLEVLHMAIRKKGEVSHMRLRHLQPRLPNLEKSGEASAHPERRDGVRQIRPSTIFRG